MGWGFVRTVGLLLVAARWCRVGVSGQLERSQTPTETGCMVFETAPTHPSTT